MDIEQHLKAILEASLVSFKLRENWQFVSKTAIDNKEVEPLSTKGLLQVVDLLSYHIITEAHIANQQGLTDDEFYENQSHDLSTQDEIIQTAAKATGVHPEIIEEMIEIRCDHYTDLYNDLIGSVE
jgi:hypothetical protein